MCHGHLPGGAGPPEAFLTLLLEAMVLNTWSLPLGSCGIYALCLKYLTETREEELFWAHGLRHHGKIVSVGQPVHSGRGSDRRHSLQHRPTSREREREKRVKREEIGRVLHFPNSGSDRLLPADPHLLKGPQPPLKLVPHIGEGRVWISEPNLKVNTWEYAM